MGIVKQQAFKNSFFIYVGVVLGYLNIVILFPRFFTDEQFGLTRVLLYASNIMAIVAHLGFSNITIKYFPYFKDPKSHHNGFLFLALLVPFIGFLLITGIFFIAKPVILSAYEDDSNLFSSYYFLIFPITFFQIYFQVLASYSRALFKTVIPNLLNEVGIKLFLTGILMLAGIGIIEYKPFLFLFAFLYSLPAVVMLIYLGYMGQLYFKPRFNKLSIPFIKEIASYGVFTLANRATAMLTQTLDILMLSAMTGFKNAAVYTIAFFIGNIVYIPSKGLNQISSPLLAHAFSKNDKNQIDNIYKKSALNQLLVGSIIFLVVWVNVEDILLLIKPDYINAVYVIFFIGLSRIFAMSNGANNQIIMHSQYYRYKLLFIVLTVCLIIVLNLILIPELGIVGAAVGSAIAVLVINLFKTIFVWAKLGFQPFSFNTLKLLFIIGICSLVSYFLPTLSLSDLSDYWQHIINIVYNGSIITLLFGTGVLVLKPSEDIDNTLRKIVKRFYK